MRLGRSVERTQQCAALYPGALLNRIDSNRTHWGEIDHQPVIRNPQADHAMSAATHADLEVETAGRPNSCPYVRDTAAANDQARLAVAPPVPYRTRRVIARTSRS